MANRGSAQEKILLLLLGGLALGLTRSPGSYFKILKGMHAEWQKINHRTLVRSIKILHQSDLVKRKDNKNGMTTFVLSKEGRKVALMYDLEKMIIPKTKWDKKWRVVMFDIPERLKKVRDTLRYQLKRLGFLELQKSVFVLPFECRNELEYIIGFYSIKRYVRFIEAYKIDNELDLKDRFRL